MPAGSPSYVILGLTDGLGHTSNPCLPAQVEWASSQRVRTGAYLVASYPDRAERAIARQGLHTSCARPLLCVLRRDGASQARDALATMHSAGLHSPRVWIDLEFRRTHRWTHNRVANAAVVQGIVRGLRHAHKPMGVYTTPYMWQDIVGSYRLYEPNWLPVGHGSARHALRMCRTTATGGTTWVVQYTRSLDNDLTCPVLNPVRGHHGRLWLFRNTTLRRLSIGPAVRVLQRKLGRRVTGRFDHLTARAVRKWQRSKDLRPTGRITPADWRALGAYRLHGGHGFWITRVAGRT
jgi:peptidoglycan hydrolase-like protein with peptidoglycan-binding domain